MALPPTVNEGDPGHLGDHEEIHVALTGGITTPWAITPPAVTSPYGTVVDGPGTNLVTNPSFEVDLAGWTANSTETLTRVVDDGVAGNACLEVSMADASVVSGAAFHDVAVGPGTYTASVFLRTATGLGGAAGLRLMAFDVGGTKLVDTGNPTTVPMGSWARFSLTFTAPANTATVRILLIEDAGAGAFAFRADAVQLEQADRVSSYLDGSLGPGYSWDGAAHASVSRRGSGLHVLNASGLFNVQGRRIGPLRGALVHLNANEPIPHATGTVVPWDVAALDTDGFWSSSSPTRLTVPDGVNYVRVWGQLGWAVSANGYVRQGMIRKNAANMVGRGMDSRPTIGGNNNVWQQPTTGIIPVVAGDYFDIVATQDSGATLDLASVSGYVTWFTVEVIG